MVYLTIILFLVTVFLLTRLFTLKKEVKKISKQLQIYNNRKTNKKIDMVLLDKNIEILGMEINRLIDLYVTENRNKVQFENEQQQVISLLISIPKISIFLSRRTISIFGNGNQQTY